LYYFYLSYDFINYFCRLKDVNLNLERSNIYYWVQPICILTTFKPSQVRNFCSLSGLCLFIELYMLVFDILFEVPRKLLLALAIVWRTCSQIYVGNRLFFSQERFQSSYLGKLARRLRDSSEAEEVSYLKELYGQNDPEAVIRVFESQPSLHTNSAALSEYVKALVKVDKLDETELLQTLRRGDYFARTACFLLTVFACDHAFLCLTNILGTFWPSSMD